ncbi:MAG: 30S ribosomal protein S9 [Candidatus Micrarchaeota archaeon]|nr:30S ribosomal protein S9 [Candidatus Micrarchaeota archaeon]
MAETTTQTVEAEAKPEVQEEKPQKEAPKKRAPRRKAQKKAPVKQHIEFVKSKRKSAVARASSRGGTGKIRVNGFDINVVEPIELRRLMLEPLYVSGATEQQARGIDIRVSVYGGGQSAQAQAVRGAIAKSIVAASKSDAIRQEYIRYDRFILIDDTRRVEPKKFKGPKARARFQKSYR